MTMINNMGCATTRKGGDTSDGGTITCVVAVIAGAWEGVATTSSSGVSMMERDKR